MELAKLEQLIKIGLAGLLLICLAHMPYGYYQFVRIASMLGFGYLAYLSYEKNDQTSFLIFLILAVLFQPLIKIALGRALWNVVDFVVAIWLIWNIVKQSKK